MHLRHTWAIAAIATFLAASMLPTAGATPTANAAMMQPVLAAANAINSANPAAIRSGVYADNATIIDEFAPFVWSGTAAGVAYINDFAAFAKKNHLSAKATLMPVKTFDRSGDWAYLVVPTKFAGTMNGKAVNETGTWTFTLKRSATKWFIATQTWGTISSTM